MYNTLNIHPVLSPDCLEKNRPFIITVSEFNDEGYNKFKNDFNKALQNQQTIIPIVVDSYGGYVYSLNGMLSTIRNSPVPVATFIETKAMSCGSVIASAGHKGYRFATKEATMLIHEVSGGAWGKQADVEVSSQEIDRLNNFLLETLARNAGKGKNYFKELIHKKKHADWYLTAEEMLEHGLIDHIAYPTFEVNVDVSYKLKY